PKSESPSRKDAAFLLDSASKLIQVVSVVAGVVFSVVSFNDARMKEATAKEAEANSRALEEQRYRDQRNDEAEKRQTEAAKPFLEHRQKLYLEAAHAAGVLGNPKDHTEQDVKNAKTRFRELYVAELSLVEASDVESKMKELAGAIDPELTTLTK